MNLRMCHLKVRTAGEQLNHFRVIGRLRFCKAVKVRLIRISPPAFILASLDIVPENRGKLLIPVFNQQDHVNITGRPKFQGRLVHQDIAGCASDNGIAILIPPEMFLE